MKVEEGLFGKKVGTSERSGGVQERLMGINMIKVHYIHVRKCHCETHYFIQLIYAHKKKKRKRTKREKEILAMVSNANQALCLSALMAGLSLHFPWTTDQAPVCRLTHPLSIKSGPHTATPMRTGSITNIPPHLEIFY
jgi:hypothetical protein